MDERSFTMRTNEERLNELLAHLDSLDHIHVDEIPQIDLLHGSGDDLYGEAPR